MMDLEIVVTQNVDRALHAFVAVVLSLPVDGSVNSNLYRQLSLCP
jgi:hypothetical protein